MRIVLRQGSYSGLKFNPLLAVCVNYSYHFRLGTACCFTDYCRNFALATPQQLSLFLHFFLSSLAISKKAIFLVFENLHS